MSGSLLDSLHGDGEGHPREAALEKLLDLSEQEEKACTLSSFFAWPRITANVWLYVDLLQQLPKASCRTQVRTGKREGGTSGHPHNKW